VTRPRDPDQIEREIETTRTQLAGTLDELAEKVSPKRLAGQAKDTTVEWFRTPPGMAVLGGVGLLVLVGVVRKIRNRG
jgi:proteasome assembly chaperone (PAC2) family protein